MSWWRNGCIRWKEINRYYCCCIMYCRIVMIVIRFGIWWMRYEIVDVIILFVDEIIECLKSEIILWV